MNWDMRGLRTALDELVGFLPNLVAGLVILLIGYIIAALLARGTRALLTRLHFDRLTNRLGVTTTTSEPHTGARWVGKAVFIVVMLATVMQVAKAWNLGFVAVGFARIIGYVPHVLAAAVILGVALYLGNWVRDRLAQSRLMTAGPDTAREEQLRLMPSLIRGGIIAIGVFMALRELQFAPEIVNVAFTLLLGAIALATALAFGLGGRDTAGRIAQAWYERRRGEVRRGEVVAEPGHDMEFPQRDITVPSRP